MADITIQPGVLFICLGNSCRSIMAEALAKHFLPDSVTAGSAGISPLGYIARETLEVLAELGVALAGLRSKGLEEIDFAAYPLIVNLTTYALDVLLPAAGGSRLINHAVTDPFGGTLEQYRRTRDAIQRFITNELPHHLAML